MSTESALRADLDAEDRKILAEDRKRINDRPRYCGKVDQRPRRGGAWLLARGRGKRSRAAGRCWCPTDRSCCLNRLWRHSWSIGLRRDPTSHAAAGTPFRPFANRGCGRSALLE